MSFLHKLEGALDKGKAKLKELADSRTGQQPQQHQQHYPPPPGQQPYYPPQQQQPYYPPQQQQPFYNAPPPQQQSYPGGPPPVPSWNKPHSHSPQPPIPSSTRPHPPQMQSYWQPHFDPSLPISTYFIHETGSHGWGNNESQNYTNSPQNSFFGPSQLIVRGIVNSSAEHDKYTSARLISEQRLARTCGFLSATVRAPCAHGIWPAFWLLPAQPFTWPNDGEVDIFESWNGDCVNHSCLHWGHFNGEDWNKHRVLETPIHDMAHREVTMGFAWQQNGDHNGAGGKMVWYIDGKAIMKANIPEGTRRLSDYRIIINVAMGGNVCQGKLPADGTYDFVLRDLGMWDTPPGGWDQFTRDFEGTTEGKTM
ncbi:hypothetical protein HYFRA_00007410 [Hymenoscyphus fraxineus]|uniref:GH16 domain-containing protein n=1 Tax=Hymenoscyphus fraxineus TaxID=746836 RepID=A0A9N9KPG6_9HELO|nr:hypothetical protein HYFRA_00007410 [Hymenoscyphus fraxineus]